MNKKTNEELRALVDKAVSGDKKSLEELVADVQDIVFNLSLRMLGTFADAEDATQDILLKMITHLSSFRGESAFTTWVFRIAVNHLKNYKKHMFAQHPLNFEYYGDDIKNGKIQDLPDLSQNVERDILAEELKMSCTNVMLQCLDVENRCIFILGSISPAAFTGTQKDGGFSYGILRRVRKRQMQVQRQDRLCDTEPQAGSDAFGLYSCHGNSC